MANEFDLQGPCDDSNHSRGLDIERMANELDEFVNEVSLELSVISGQLGQTPDLRTTPRLDATPQNPSSLERTPLAERRPLAEHRPLAAPLPPAKRVADSSTQASESRIQAIRNRLARVNPDSTGDKRGTRKHE